MTRSWNRQQRLEQSRKRRGHDQLCVDTPKGRRHFELVNHLRASNMLELILAYEAKMNGIALEDWINCHRNVGKLTGKEIYLPPGTFVVPLDRDPLNSSFSNVYCFLTRKERLNFKFELDFPDNEEEVKAKSREYTIIRKQERKIFDSFGMS